MSNPTGEPPKTEVITIDSNLESAPQYAEQLGHVCVAWANLEWHMYQLFQLMSGAPPAVARSTFYAVESARGRREILAAVSRTVLENPSDRAVLDDILRRIGKSSGQRNKYVHDTWGVARTQRREIFQLRLSNSEADQDMEEVTIPDLKNAIAQLNKLTDELTDFFHRVSSSVPVSVEKLRSRPGIGLTFAKKGNPPGRKLKGHHGPRK
jgi:hypothetical protein